MGMPRFGCGHRTRPLGAIGDPFLIQGVLYGAGKPRPYTTDGLPLKAIGIAPNSKPPAGYSMVANWGAPGFLSTGGWTAWMKKHPGKVAAWNMPPGTNSTPLIWAAAAGKLPAPPTPKPPTPKPVGIQTPPVSFTVASPSAAGAGAGTTATAATGITGWLEGSTSLAGFNVPDLAIAGVAALGLYLLVFRKKAR
ncbi:MAG TPA: hypothetical protein VGS20_00005 [Candidatus Acidoferrales bacterium]|nr:hypothetical protein [Candidatus Acidoferrales bacterium]HEV2385613.1 hypothetical protein [Candidatus Acidoferrales bacterium]